jgi:hypothetical protein
MRFPTRNLLYFSIHRQHPLPPLCCIFFGVNFTLQNRNTKPETLCSRGTTASDARIKPDLVAPGEETLSAFGPGSDNKGVLIPTQPNHCVIPSQTAARSASDDANKALIILSGTSMCAHACCQWLRCPTHICRVHARPHHPAGPHR